MRVRDIDWRIYQPPAAFGKLTALADIAALIVILGAVLAFSFSKKRGASNHWH